MCTAFPGLLTRCLPSCPLNTASAAYYTWWFKNTVQTGFIPKWAGVREICYPSGHNEYDRYVQPNRKFIAVIHKPDLNRSTHSLDAATSFTTLLNSFGSPLSSSYVLLPRPPMLQFLLPPATGKMHEVKARWRHCKSDAHFLPHILQQDKRREVLLGESSLQLASEI